MNIFRIFIAIGGIVSSTSMAYASEYMSELREIRKFSDEEKTMILAIIKGNPHSETWGQTHWQFLAGLVNFQLKDINDWKDIKGSQLKNLYYNIRRIMPEQKIEKHTVNSLEKHTKQPDIAASLAQENNIQQEQTPEENNMANIDHREKVPQI